MASKNSRRAVLKTLATAPLLPAALSAEQQPPASLASEADALTEVVRIRYGQYLSDAEMGEIKTGIERMLRNAETISRVKIGNSDGPDFLFHPHDSIGGTA